MSIVDELASRSLLYTVVCYLTKLYVNLFTPFEGSFNKVLSIITSQRPKGQDRRYKVIGLTGCVVCLAASFKSSVQGRA